VSDAAEELRAILDKQSDGQIWNLAVLFVSFAGKRAAQRKRDDVNDACATFVETMHEYVGTPEAPEHVG
jgi:hypothetical protein